MAREVDDHDAVLLHDAHQHEHTDKGVKRRFLSKNKQRQQSTNESCRQSRKYRQRVNVTLVKDREYHVHHKHCERHQDRQTRHRTTERERLALQLTTHTARHRLRRCFRDEVRRITKRNTRFEIEEERHTRELVQVVHYLWPKRLFPRHELAQRHESFTVI